MSTGDRAERKKLIEEAMWEFWRPYFVKLMVGTIFFTLGSVATIFAAGVWAKAIHSDINALLKTTTRMEDETSKRIASWTLWREGVDDRMRSGSTDRFTGNDYNSAASIFNMRMPMTQMPYLWEIRKDQGRP